MKSKLLVCLLVVVFLSLNGAVASAQTVDVGISKNLSDLSGASIMIPIEVGDLSGLDVFSYNVTVAFDQNVLDATGVTVTGTLTEGITPTISDMDGQIVVAVAATSALTGSGNLIYLNFDVLGMKGDQTALTFAEFQFNEGIPAANTTGGSFIVGPLGLYEDWFVEFPNAHRGIGVCPLSGRVYVGNTSDYKINYFNPGNETGIPDGYIENEGWAGWLGPYGVDVADDGMVYVTTFGATKSVFQIAFDGTVKNIYEVGQNMRALTVYGGGVNTTVYCLENGGSIYKFTTDGTTWNMETLFDCDDNASIAVSPDGNTLYTVGYGTAIHKWDAAGTADTTFKSPASCIAVRMNENGSKLFAMYNAIAGADTASFLGQLDPATGDVIESIIVGPRGKSPTYGMVNAFDILDDRDFFWSSSAGYRGKAVDANVTVDNRPPFAYAGNDQIVEIFNEVTLDGSQSVDVDADPIAYSWSVVSAPEAVTLSDPAAAMSTFTPMMAGDYTFQLIVNDGALDSPADEVTITVFQKNLNLTFDVDKDRDRDIPNWGIYSLTNRYSATEWDTTGGVGGSGALLIRDGGWGFAMERPLNATPGTNFKLTADVLVHGVTVPFYFQVSGITVEPVNVQIENHSTNFVTIELQGITVNETGYIQIFGETGGGADSVWVDNLIFEDDATLDVYTLSGKVTLSDMPADMSGSEVSIVQTSSSVATDENGDYTFPGLIAGTYDIKFSKTNYKDVMVDDYEIAGDSTLNVTLPRNQPPVAEAGDDIMGAQASAYVTLDGSGSSDPDGDSLKYYWTCPDPTVVIETSTENPVAGFRPMDINDFKFYLVVNDGTEDSEADSVMVSVTLEAPPPLGYEFVDNFVDMRGSQGIVVDPEGKIWTGSYYAGESYEYVRVWNSDGTVPDWAPITRGVIGTDTLEITDKCYGMAIDKDGNVYYSSAALSAVLKFDYHDGTPLGGIQLASGSPTMGVDENGYIFVGTVVGDSVWIYDKDFTIVNRVYVESIGREVEVSPDGSVIFVGGFSGTVNRFEGTPTTSYTKIDPLPGPFKTTELSGGDMSDIGFDMHGRLWVNEAHNDGIDRFHIYSPDLTTRETLTPPENEQTDRPRGIGFDHTRGDSLIYISDFGGLHYPIQRWAIPGTDIPAIFYTIAEVAEVDQDGFPVLADKKVRIKGIITVAGEFGGTGPAYIQDAVDSAAVAIYDYRAILPDSVKIGDEIIVSGEVGFYNGLTEIDPPDEFSIVSSGNVIDPFLITCADLADTAGEMYQSELVKIENIHAEETLFPSNANMFITDKTGSAVMRIDKDTNIPDKGVPADSFDVIGVVTQYDSQSPFWGGYQIMPRSAADLGFPVSVSDETNGLPASFALYQNYPNPFNPVTNIKYDLPKDCHVKIQVFNILGQKVRTLVDGYQEAGYKSILWNGLNDAGNQVASGTYIYMIKAVEFNKTKRMTLVK